MAKPPPQIDIVKHPEFRVIHVSGVFGAIRADEGFIKFYLDIVEPRIKAGGKHGEMEIGRITTEIQVEVRMTSMTFVGIANWMSQHVQELQKKGILKVEKENARGNASISSLIFF